MEFLKELEANLEVADFDMDVEELEEVVTPGFGYGCQCS